MSEPGSKDMQFNYVGAKQVEVQIEAFGQEGRIHRERLVERHCIFGYFETARRFLGVVFFRRHVFIELKGELGKVSFENAVFRKVLRVERQQRFHPNH